MKENYAKKLSTFSIISGFLSLYIYLIQGLRDMNFDNPIPLLILPIPIIIVGVLIIIQIKNNNKNLKILIMALTIIWGLILLFSILVLLFSNETLLFKLILLIYPIYPVYSGINFLKYNKNDIKSS